MEERIQKLLSAAGVCSRRQGEEYLLAGRVTVNGLPASLGDKADPGRDAVALDGVPLRPISHHTYLMLHKPPAILPPSPMRRDAKLQPSWWRTAASGSGRWDGWTTPPRGFCFSPTTET